MEEKDDGEQGAERGYINRSALVPFFGVIAQGSEISTNQRCAPGSSISALPYPRVRSPRNDIDLLMLLAYIVVER
jgi:hypothetical protein